jgi:hypothetical protein
METLARTQRAPRKTAATIIGLIISAITHLRFSPPALPVARDFRMPASTATDTLSGRVFLQELARQVAIAGSGLSEG